MEHILFIFFIGMISSFMGIFGGGGGFICLPSLVALGIPIHYVIATTKFSGGISSISNFYYIWKSKQVEKPIMLKLILFGLLGGIIGALITSFLQETLLNWVALFALVLSFLYTLKKKNNETKESCTTKNLSTSEKINSTLLGIYDGGFGLGTVSMLVNTYMKNGKSFSVSAQMARVLVIGSSIGNFLVFSHSNMIQWDLALPLTISFIVGSYIGLFFLDKTPNRFAVKFVQCISFILILQMAWKLF